MIKVKYPTDRSNLHNSYVEVFSKYNNKDEINIHLQTCFSNEENPITFDKLIISSFDTLIKIQPSLTTYRNSLNENNKLNFDSLFNYENKQSDIANFFMQQKHININSCYYCNIDYINSFYSLSKDYQNVFDFVNNASKKELELIDGIGKETALKIEEKRPLKTESNFSFLNKNVRENLKRYSQNTHNHFTLDHVFPQGEYPFFSLNLYNFVPSCYACNCKFKNDNKFTINENLKYISPSSDNFSLPKHFKFNILYNEDRSNLYLNYKVSKHKKYIKEYLKIFKIIGRYIHHKKEITKLRQLVNEYPDQKIKEMAKITNSSFFNLKAQIFGQELFKEEYDNTPLVKFKRDIAKVMGIKGVRK